MERSAKPDPAESFKRDKSLFRTWARDLIISIGVSAFIILFLYQPVKVEGTSMLPGLRDQERIFINKFVYELEPISRGDIVVFHYPRNPSQSFIKRVIAVGGDRVKIVRGQVYVNDRPVSEPYIPRQYRDYLSFPEITVPQNSFYVLGDHRSLSNDSRDFGPVKMEYLTGKAVMIYWPVANFGLLQ